MDQALRDTPVEIFKPPDGITLMKVDIETGLPNEGGSMETIMEAFVDGTLPGKQGHEKENSSGNTPVRRGFPGDASAPPNY
jgi:membrane carboxypeptidase/penicillin-binding protein